MFIIITLHTVSHCYDCIGVESRALNVSDMFEDLF